VELSPEIKTEAINAQESEGTEAEDNSGNEPAVPTTLAADKDSKFLLQLKFIWFDKC